MITIQNLTKTYHTKSGEVEALRGISAEIRDGDIFGIIGLSGAGKSTLLRCIALLETPTSGSISIDGRDLSSLRGRQLTEHRRQIGVIFQGYNLLMQRTVSGNIAFPLEIAGVPKAEIRRRTEELIHLVGLDGKADAYPSQLSGGQCQRVAIARALANNPKVLLCDEPTSALGFLHDQGDPGSAFGHQPEAGRHHYHHHPRDRRGKADLQSGGCDRIRSLRGIWRCC